MGNHMYPNARILLVNDDDLIAGPVKAYAEKFAPVDVIPTEQFYADMIERMAAHTSMPRPDVIISRHMLKWADGPTKSPPPYESGEILRYMLPWKNELTTFPLVPKVGEGRSQAGLRGLRKVREKLGEVPLIFIDIVDREDIAFSERYAHLDAETFLLDRLQVDPQVGRRLEQILSVN